MRITPLLLTAGALLLADRAAAQWAVSDASLRFDYTVDSPPSAASAGVLVLVPDGGLLPTPAPRPAVFDENGKPLDFDTVWHNPQEGLGLVIAKPAGSRFSVYVGRQSRLARNERAAFNPGPLFFVKTGNASLEIASRLASGFPPGREAVMGPVSLIGQQENPLGPDNDFSGYFQAWLEIDKAGRYYIATISDEGSLFKIDGKTVAEWPGLHKRQAGAKGQFGAPVELTKGLHLVEYFYFNIQGLSEAQLVWKAPGTTNALPTLVPPSAYLQSGRSRLTGVAEKDKGPVALPSAPCENYLWFAEQPDNLHRLAPLFPECNPANTVYEWKMDDGKVVRETNFFWIFEGSAPRPVTLTARSGNKSSTAACTVTLPSTPPSASINNAFQRTQYRTALLTRCRAAAAPARPAADWPPGLWQVLMNVVEPFKGQSLLLELFERSREDLAQNLAPAERALLEDLFMDNLRYTDTKKAGEWIDRFAKDEKNIDRKRDWELVRIELALYQAGDTNLARQTAVALAGSAPGSEAGVLGLVRQGDIEALDGRFDKARALYAQAQTLTPRKAGALAAAPGKPGASGLARNKEDLEEGRKKPAPPKDSSPFKGKVDAWKAEAVRGGAYYETIRDLLQKGFVREARQELRNWELELPTEKLGGEYPVAEAEYFTALRDFNRAQLILSTYRKAVDVSPFMPRAMGMELDCLVNLGRMDEARALAAVVLRRFPGHPVAEQARRVRDQTAGSERQTVKPSVEVP